MRCPLSVDLVLTASQLAELLEKDVNEIHRMEVVHCYKMAEKRLSNLMDIVSAHATSVENQRSEGGSSSEPIPIG